MRAPCDYEKLTVATIKNKPSALRRLVRKSGCDNIIVAYGENNLKIYENKLKEYKNISPEVVIALLEKICRQKAEKESLPLPFGETYIVASPHTALETIYALHSLSRLFTVVSPCEIPQRMYDELYFKHGTLVRNIPYFNNDIRDDSMIISFSEEKIFYPPATPLINIYDEKGLCAANVSVYDESIAREKEEWGGECGAAFYSLFGKIPGENALVDINRRADKIFMLDTAAF